MFDLGWSEMAVIAVLALILLGPKELPNALRAVSGFLRQARKLAGEFRSGVDELIREADLEDARQQLQGLDKHGIARSLERSIDPDGALKEAMSAAPGAEADKPIAGSESAKTPSDGNKS